MRCGHRRPRPEGPAGRVHVGSSESSSQDCVRFHYDASRRSASACSRVRVDVFREGDEIHFQEGEIILVLPLWGVRPPHPQMLSQALCMSSVPAPTAAPGAGGGGGAGGTEVGTGC